jgi:hypothetical protein
MGMKWIGFAIEIAWLIVRMAKQSSVATRRNHDAVNGPWVETHGYHQMSLRDICEQAIMLHENSLRALSCCVGPKQCRL